MKKMMFPVFFISLLFVIISCDWFLSQTKPAVPNPPVITVNDVSESQIDLSWQIDLNDITGFVLEENSGNAFIQIESFDNLTTTYSRKGLSPNTLYQYRLRAINKVGFSNYSNIVEETTEANTTTELPLAPTNLIASTLSSSQISLNWTDSSTIELGYKIERSNLSSVSGFTQIGIVGENITSFTDTNLISETTYWYRVLAYNSGGDSSFSNIINSTTSEEPSNTQIISIDFEDTTLGSWPINWVKDANASASGNEVIIDPRDSTNKALKIFGTVGGCWGALTYYPCEFPSDFYMECDVYNGAEILSGCHPERGGLGMRSGTSWSNPYRRFVQFMGNGEIRGTDNLLLGTYNNEEWYSVKIHYNRIGTSLTMSYWINGISVGQSNVILDDLAQEESLNHFDLVSQEGSSIFDNINVYTDEEEPIPSLPSPIINQTPSNMITSVSVNANLSWSNGGGATSYDVYFGTDSSPDSGEFEGNQIGTSFNLGTLNYSTTYYWRIDARNSTGTTTGTVFRFTTEAEPILPPIPTTNPTPSNSATNVSVNTDLFWSNGAGATSYDVYFGTDSSPDSGESEGNQSGTSFNLGTLNYSTTYYWRVDSKNSTGTTTGTVWRFTTESEPISLPARPINPSPSHTTTGVSVNANLSWSNGGSATSYDVYFGTDSSPDSGESEGNQTGNSFNLGTLNYSTTYYWRINSRNSAGSTTGTVWRFTTVAASVPFISKIEGPSSTIDSLSAYFDWSASDSDGSIDHYEYRKDDGNWISITNSYYSWYGYSEGTHQFSVRAIDNDNLESDVISWSFLYDDGVTVVTPPFTNAWFHENAADTDVWIGGKAGFYSDTNIDTGIIGIIETARSAVAGGSGVLVYETLLDYIEIKTPGNYIIEFEGTISYYTDTFDLLNWLIGTNKGLFNIELEAQISTEERKIIYEDTELSPIKFLEDIVISSADNLLDLAELYTPTSSIKKGIDIYKAVQEIRGIQDAFSGWTVIKPFRISIPFSSSEASERWLFRVKSETISTSLGLKSMYAVSGVLCDLDSITLRKTN